MDLLDRHKVSKTRQSTVSAFGCSIKYKDTLTDSLTFLRNYYSNIKIQESR